MAGRPLPAEAGHADPLLRFDVAGVAMLLEEGQQFGPADQMAVLHPITHQHAVCDPPAECALRSSKGSSCSRKIAELRQFGFVEAMEGRLGATVIVHPHHPRA